MICIKVCLKTYLETITLETMQSTSLWKAWKVPGNMKLNKTDLVVNTEW